MSQQHVEVPGARNTAIWVIGALFLFYLGLLSLLLFLPGGTVLERLRWLDSGICAQLLTHSFYPGGQRLPLCARNTGIYLGFMVTLISLYASGKGRSQQLPPLPIMLLCAGGIFALIVDGVNSLALDLNLPHLYRPDNLLRLGTGLLTGMALVLLALPILNQLFWREYNEERIVRSWWQFALLLSGLVLCFLAVASQNALLLYPIAFISTAGVLSALSSVNLIFLTAFSKRGETFQHYSQLFAFFSLALAGAVAEMLVLAQLKVTLLHALGL